MYPSVRFSVKSARVHLIGPFSPLRLRGLNAGVRLTLTAVCPGPPGVKSRCSTFLITALAATLAATCLSQAQATRTWDGGADTNNWFGDKKDGERNWDKNNDTLITGSNLEFQGDTRPTSHNNSSSSFFNIRNISFLCNATAFTLTGGSLELTGNVTNSSSHTQTIILDLRLAAPTANVFNNGAGNLVLGGAISGTGKLTKSGTGTLILSGSAANTYVGVTTVTEGILQLGKTGVNAIAGNLTVGDGSGLDIVRLAGSNQISDSATLTLNGSGDNAGMFQLYGNSEIIGGLVSTGAGVVENGGTGASTLTVDVNAMVMAFEGVIQNGGAVLNLVKSGTSTQSISGTVANTYTGTTTVTGGILDLNKSAGVNAIVSSAIAIGDGVGYDILRLSADDQIADSSIISFNGKNTNAGIFRLNGKKEMIGGLVSNDAGVVENGVAGASTLTLGVSSNSSFGGILQNGGAGTLALVKSGTATQTLSGTAANTYSGTTTVTGGILDLNKTAGLNAIGGNLTIGDGATTSGLDVVRLLASNQIADTSIVTFNGTLGNAGTLRLNAQSETIGGLVSTNGAGVVENGAAGTSTLTLAVNSSSSFAGIIQNGAAGTLALVKSGSATQTLNGASTYTGLTTVSGGVLALGSAGTINNSSGVRLADGSQFNVTAKVGGYSVNALSGAGSVSGDLTVANALGGAGLQDALTFNNSLTLGASSASTFEIGLNNFDLAQGGVGTQSVTFAGTLNILFSSGYNTVGTTKIFNFESYGGTFSRFNVSGLANGYQASFNQLGTVTVSVIPEPGTFLLALFGLGGFVRRRRA